MVRTFNSLAHGRVQCVGVKLHSLVGRSSTMVISCSDSLNAIMVIIDPCVSINFDKQPKTYSPALWTGPFFIDRLSCGWCPYPQVASFASFRASHKMTFDPSRITLNIANYSRDPFWIRARKFREYFTKVAYLKAGTYCHQNLFHQKCDLSPFSTDPFIFKLGEA